MYKGTSLLLLTSIHTHARARHVAHLCLLGKWASSHLPCCPIQMIQIGRLEQSGSTSPPPKLAQPFGTAATTATATAINTAITTATATATATATDLQELRQQESLRCRRPTKDNTACKLAARHHLLYHAQSSPPVRTSPPHRCCCVLGTAEHALCRLRLPNRGHLALCQWPCSGSRPPRGTARLLARSPVSARNGASTQTRCRALCVAPCLQGALPRRPAAGP